MSNITKKFNRRTIAVVAISLLILVALVLLFVIYGLIANKNGNKGDASTSQTGNPSNSTTNLPAQGAVSKNSIGMELVNIPAGSFMMGSENGQVPSIIEKPVHKVTISKPFLLGKYEVTQEQWQSVMGSKPSRFKDCPNCPVEQVSWDDAQNFINKLNGKNDGYQYRLPTEAEWEYACRAGTTGDYYGSLDSIAWYSDNSGNKTHPVGQKQANAFGLYDMSGNVWEWMQDIANDTYSDLPTDGTANLSVGHSDKRVLRGGAWSSSGDNERSSFRAKYSPGAPFPEFGFRVAASVR